MMGHLFPPAFLPFRRARPIFPPMRARRAPSFPLAGAPAPARAEIYLMGGKGAPIGPPSLRSGRGQYCPLAARRAVSLFLPAPVALFVSRSPGVSCPASAGSAFGFVRASGPACPARAGAPGVPRPCPRLRRARPGVPGGCVGRRRLPVGAPAAGPAAALVRLRPGPCLAPPACRHSPGSAPVGVRSRAGGLPPACGRAPSLRGGGGVGSAPALPPALLGFAPRCQAAFGFPGAPPAAACPFCGSVMAAGGPGSRAPFGGPRIQCAIWLGRLGGPSFCAQIAGPPRGFPRAAGWALPSLRLRPSARAALFCRACGRPCGAAGLRGSRSPGLRPGRLRGCAPPRWGYGLDKGPSQLWLTGALFLIMKLHTRQGFHKRLRRP